MADLRAIFDNLFASRQEGMQREAEMREPDLDKLKEQFLKSPLSPTGMPIQAFEAYKKYINPVLWAATVMHSPVGSPMTSELKNGEYVPLEKPRKITEEDKRAAEGMVMTRMAELLVYRGGAALANKYIAPQLKPLYYRLARKTTGGKVPKEVIDRLWNKLGSSGVGQLTDEEMKVYNAMLETGKKTGQPVGKLFGEARKTGAVKLLGTKDVAKPVAGAIEHQPVYRPEWKPYEKPMQPPTPEPPVVGQPAKVTPRVPTLASGLTPTETEVIRRPLGKTMLTPETGEPAAINRVYDPKSGQPVEYQSYFIPEAGAYKPLKVGLAGGTAKDVIGGEVGLGGLPATPPEEELKLVSKYKSVAGGVVEQYTYKDGKLTIHPDYKPNAVGISNVLVKEKGKGTGTEMMWAALKKIAREYPGKDIVVYPETERSAKWNRTFGFEGSGTPYRPMTLKSGMLQQPPPTEPPTAVAGAEPPAEKPITPREAIDIVTAKIKLTKPMRKEVEAKYTMERGKRIEQVEEALKTTKGQEGYFASLGKMKGKLLPEQPTFEPVEPQLTQPVIDKLYEVVQSNRNYDSFEKLTIQDGLTRVLRGQLPQPHQYPYLEDVFGAKFMEAVMTNKPTLHKIRDIATNILNLPKAFVASFDISAPFRQGVMWTLRPSQAPVVAQAARHMFKVLFSEKAYEGWYKQIKEDPLYKTMIKNKVDITDPSVVSRGLSGKEEVFMTNIPKMVVDEPHLKNTPIGWIAQGMRASERAYTGFLNKLRFDLAKRMFSHEIKDGANPKSETRAFKSVAEFVNSSTGRGDLGRLNVVARELNNAFWSPRLVKARLDFLNPGWYARQTPYVRKEAIKGFAEMIGTGISILTLIKLAGGKRVNVETDPRSTDFGKIRIGNTRWDVWGGYQQFVRTFVQVASGQRKTTRGKVVSMSKKKFPFETRLDRIISFAKGKLSPTAALALEISDGQRMFGGNLVPLEEIERKFIPMYIQDIIESYNDLGPHAFWAVAIPAITGVGVQTYQENRPSGAATTAEDLARKLKRKKR